MKVVLIRPSSKQIGEGHLPDLLPKLHAAEHITIPYPMLARILPELLPPKLRILGVDYDERRSSS